jgi:hypothetical protein
MLRWANGGVTTVKPGHQGTVNALVIWRDESSFTLFPTSGRVYVRRTPKEAYNSERLLTTVKHGGGSGPIHCQITAREYADSFGNQMHPSNDSDVIF